MKLASRISTLLLTFLVTLFAAPSLAIPLTLSQVESNQVGLLLLPLLGLWWLVRPGRTV